MTIGSIFSGIGGLELGLEMAGLGPVRWQAEISPFCRRVLAKRWPGVPCHEDVRSLRGRDLEPVAVMCGGFPCQGTSSANLNKPGLSHEASGLWSEYVRIVSEVRPRFVVVENVEGLVRRGLDQVVSDLDSLGYEVEGTLLDAASVGAPFRGARVFLVAQTDSYREPVVPEHGEVAVVREHAARIRDWRSPFRGPTRVGDGVPGGMDRSRSLGNAVVPPCAAIVGARILERMRGSP